MYNLYDNSFLAEDSQNIYIPIALEHLNESYTPFILIINHFLKNLIESPEIIYKIIKYSKEEELTDSFILFITNNLYNDILSPEIISEKFLIIIENLLYDEIYKLSKIEDLIIILTNSKISKLLLGVKYYNEVQNYFNLLVGDIIENYENSGANTIPLIFKIDKLKEYIKLKEEMLNNELNSEKEFKREEANRKKMDEANTLNNIYKMKFSVDDSTSNSLSGLFSLDEEEYFHNEMNNSALFMEKYAPELSKNELENIMEKHSDNDYIQYFLKRQMHLLQENGSIYCNTIFFEHIQVLKDPEKILYYYQRNFNVVKEIILNIYQKFRKTSHLIPYIIKCICRIIYNLLKLKFPDFKNIEIDKYIKIFFFKIILEPFIISSDYSNMMTTTIISQETKENLKIIFDVWKQFIYGNFYSNNDNEYSDYTPFNWFFIDLIQESMATCEKLIDVNMPKYLLRYNLKENKIISNKLKCYKIDKNIYSYSACFNINNLILITNIINRNTNYFFENPNDLSINEFKKYFNEIHKYKDILKELKEKDNSNKINYYIYYNIFYGSKLSEIVFEGKKIEYFQIKEIKEEKSDKDEELFNLIKIKNALSDLLFHVDLSFFNDKINIFENNLRDLLVEIMKINNVKYYIFKNKKDDNIDYKYLIKESINNNKDFNVFPEINSLIELIERISQKYMDNNFELLFNSFLNDISSSINRYKFEILTPILDCLTNLKENTNIYLLNQEKYKNSIINSKLRQFYENEQIEIKMKFKYNEEEQYFLITKGEVLSKNTNKKSKLIKCHTIPDFIRKFPNFSQFQIKKEVDLLDLKTKLNLRESLVNYFYIVKSHLILHFPEKEIKNVYSKIKKRILIKLYNKIFPKEPDDDDLTLHFQCISLSWIKLFHLKQKEIHNDNFIKITTNLFNQMNLEKSYLGKLEIIEKIFKTFSNVLKINKGKNYSTDDIAPLCEYALIKAKPERLSSNLKFIQIMMPEKCSNLSKMHLDYLKNYINVLKNCNYKLFYGITEKEFNDNCIKAKNKVFEINTN